MLAVRLNRGQDLKQEICNFVTAKNLSSACVISAVGSLNKVTLRMAGAQPGRQDIRVYDGIFEITSLIGTVDKNGEAHLHMSVADSEGRVIGGHIKDDCSVYTTVELIIANSPTLTFERVLDDSTGFDELTIKEEA